MARDGEGGTSRQARSAATRGAKGGAGTRTAAAPLPEEARFRAAFAASRDAIGVSRAGVHLLVNPAYLALFGFPGDTDLAGTPVLDLIAPESRDRVGQYVARRARGDSAPTVYETRGRRADGTTFDLEVSASLFREGGEDLTLTILRDVTARRRTEREHAERGATLQQIMDTASVAIFLVDKAGLITHANRRMGEMFGWKTEELTGSEYVSLVHPSEREIGRAKMLALLASEIESVDLERRYWRRDGSEFWGHLAGRRFHDVEGHEIGLIGVITDIDASKRLQEDLRASKNTLETIFETEPDCIKIIDRESRLVMMNRAGLAMVQADSLEQVKGRRFGSLVAPEDREAFRELAARVFAGGTGAMEFRMIGLRGASLWLETRAVPLRDERGEIAAMLGVTRDVTARRQAEEALRQSEAKFRRLYHQTPVLLHSIDRDGILVEVNDYWLRTLGYSREEVIGRPATDFYTEASRRQAREVVQPAFFRDGVARDIAYQFVKKSGEAVDVLLSATAERDASGAVVRSQAVILDVTERTRAEREARRNQERMASLERISQHPVDDEKGYLDFALHEAITLTGSAIGYLYLYDETSREFTLNSYSRDVMRECSIEDRKSCYELDKTGIWGEAVRQRRPILLNDFEAEHPLKRGYPEGHARLRRFLTVPVIMQGAVVAVVGVANKPSDYTDADILQLNLMMDSVWKMVQRARAEAALRESEERYRQLFEGESDAIFLIENRTGRILMANAAASAMYGYSREELLELRNTDLSAEPSETRRVTEETPLVTENRVTIPLRYHRKKDGTVFPVEITGRFFDSQGRPVHIAAIRDITERRQLEEERLKIQKLESIGTLAGGIAHDFNNLLQGVFGYISMAKAHLDGQSRPHALLDQAEQALHQSVNLTSQLLTFSRGGRPVKRVIALRPVLESAVRFALSGSRVAFALSPEEDLSPVEADEGQLGQVFQNIVLNAEQAMPAGGRLEISLRNVPASAEPAAPGMAPGAAVAVRITDLGVGIPSAHLERIFDPYFTTKERGSGLGLATAYSIVRNHGGAITVRSEPGRGATFTVYLPASGAPLEAPAHPATPTPGRAARILVMDDEALVRDVVRELLRTLGHETVFAAHGEEAIARYREGQAAGTPFDLVILDLTIRGGMGGVDTLRALRESDPEVKAVVSSGYSNDGALAEYRHLGFSAFLKKPYVIDDLKATLDPLLA